MIETLRKILVLVKKNKMVDVNELDNNDQGVTPDDFIIVSNYLLDFGKKAQGNPVSNELLKFLIFDNYPFTLRLLEGYQMIDGNYQMIDVKNNEAIIFDKTKAITIS